MCRIESVRAREVYDSRGRPTVEVEVRCSGATRAGRAIVPSGASTGRFEAVELRDQGQNRLGGDGVRRAVGNVQGEIATALIGCDALQQADIDRRLCELDQTPAKSRLGANATLGVSLATAHAAAEAKGIPLVAHFHELWKSVPNESVVSEGQGLPASLGQSLLLPLPMVNMISGGLHAGGNLDFQDFLILPVGAATFRQAFEWVVSVHRRLGQLLREAGFEGRLVADEGGYGPKLTRNSQAVEFLLKAIEGCDLQPGDDVAVGLDVASSHFFNDGVYRLQSDGERDVSTHELIDMLEGWVEQYPIISIEDALAEDDWQAWSELTRRLGRRVQLIGDDLFVTHRSRLERGIELQAANSVLIKLNQVGTLWETMQTMRLALDCGLWPVISARSGETEDTTIADLAVATGAGQIKVGSVTRSERLAKYNQLLRLEEQLGDKGQYLGGTIFARLNRGNA